VLLEIRQQDVILDNLNDLEYFFYIYLFILCC